MSTNENEVARMSVELFHKNPTPAGACRLAYQDHRGQDVVDWPFLDQLTKAAEQCDAFDQIKNALEAILRAHESGNNGACMGEAVLCDYFAAQARYALSKVKP